MQICVDSVELAINSMKGSCMNIRKNNAISELIYYPKIGNKNRFNNNTA